MQHSNKPGRTRHGGEEVRLQAFLSRAGVASRRHSEELIATGRVFVNGASVTAPGTKVRPGVDRVEVDGEELEVQPLTWLALHKPKGYVTTRDDQYGRRTVYDLIPEKYHSLFHVGRLDRDSEGVLLLTNDGDRAHRMLHPSAGVTKEYLADVEGRPASHAFHQLVEGVEVEGDLLKAESARRLHQVDDNVYRVTIVLREGKKREVRRMLEAVGHPVKRLIRKRFGPVELGELPSGKWRIVDPAELAAVGRPERKRPAAGTTDDAEEIAPPPSKRGPRPETRTRPERPARPERAAKPDRAAKREAARAGKDDAKRAPRPEREARPGVKRGGKPEADRGAWIDAKRGPKRPGERAARPGGAKFAAKPASPRRSRDDDDAAAPRSAPARGAKPAGRDWWGDEDAGGRPESPRGSRSDARPGARRGPKPDFDRDARPEPRRSAKPDSERGERAAPKRGGKPGFGSGAKRGPGGDFNRDSRPPAKRGSRPDFDREERPGAKRGAKPDFDRAAGPGAKRSPRPDFDRERPERGTGRGFDKGARGDTKPGARAGGKRADAEPGGEWTPKRRPDRDAPPKSRANDGPPRRRPDDEETSARPKRPGGPRAGGKSGSRRGRDDDGPPRAGRLPAKRDSDAPRSRSRDDGDRAPSSRPPRRGDSDGPPKRPGGGAKRPGKSFGPVKPRRPRAD